MTVWANLDTGGASPGTGQNNEFLRAQVADIRRRQEARELRADLDLACVLLAVFAAAVTLPRIVKAICGAEADDDFTRHYAHRLAQLIRHLGYGQRTASDQS